MKCFEDDCIFFHLVFLLMKNKFFDRTKLYGTEQLKIFLSYFFP